MESPPLTSDQHEMVLEMRRVARILAYKVARKLPQHIDADDLEQEAMTGIVGAVRRWNPKAGASWTTFAQTRAQGAMQDYMRRMAFGGRNHWMDVSLTSMNKEIGSEGELSIELGDTIESGERAIADRPDRDLKAQIDTEVRENLTLDQRSALAMHHDEHLTGAQIGKAMGVTESRVCQYLAEARKSLTSCGMRERLGV